ncbi:YdhR family protein [Ramlibacter sp. PS4R-6]|uniref:YdhR family protein n=1 Tax=Ramlibacter sp. PS4R-6 TaxID=3133438 RepID=UPI0030B79E30
MIISVTTFTLPKAITLDEAKAIFKTTAPKYRDVPGLAKKHYVLSEDGRTAGGIYLWNSRKDAEALYTPAWRDFVKQKYGTEPSITYFDSPLVVDNIAGKIVIDE